MATDWAADVKKYAPNADDGVIAGVVRYCGIALRKVDSSLVAFSDKKETDRVRENFLKKKLARTEADSVLDAAIAKVGETMKADRTKNRVTVYYLLADNFNQLSLFAPKAKAAAKAPAKAPAKKSAGKAVGAAALAGVAAAATAKAPAKKKAAPAKKAAAAKTAAPAKKKAAVVATTKKTTTKKVAIKAPAAPQGLMDKAAGAGTAAVAGTVAAAGAVAATAATAASSAAGAAKDTAAKAVGAAGDAAGAVAGVAGAAVTGAAGLAAGAADKAGSAVSGAVSQLTGTGNDEDSGLGWLWWVIGLALLLFAAWYFFLRTPGDDAAPAAASTEAAAAAPVDLAAAPAEGSVAIPAGAGVTSELRDGKPVVKVYFDTGKTEVAPAFTDAAGGLKAWLEANAGSSLAISGYSDPSGNAAANAELAKNRAQAVQAALVGSGIPEASAQLVRPEETADATVPPEAARRVEVVVK